MIRNYFDLAKECGAYEILDDNCYDCSKGEIVFDNYAQLEAFAVKVARAALNPEGAQSTDTKVQECPHCDNGVKWRQDFDSPLCDKCGGSGILPV